MTKTLLSAAFIAAAITSAAHAQSVNYVFSWSNLGFFDPL